MNDIVGSALSTYGSRTSIVVYNAKDSRVDELTLQKKNDTFVWIETQRDIKVRP